MDIAALSIMLNQNKVQEQASLSVMKMAMGFEGTQADLITSLDSETTKIAELSVQPFIGSNLDIRG